jgi:hypothetical protein
VADLRRRLCDVLDVAKQTIERLATEGFVDSEEPANSVRPEKVISESALLLLAASTASSDAGIEARLEDVASCLEPHARSERMLLGICAEPALALDYALAHVCLKRIGYPDLRFDQALALVARAQARRGRERPPHRALEQHWVLRGLKAARETVTQSRRPAPACMKDSLLSRSMDVLSGSREDVYALTHALLYVRDFNLRPWRLPRRRNAILAEAEAALARSLDDQDYDLAGEVLMAWPLTGRSWSAASVFGFRVLAHVEDQAGFLPSTGTRLERLNQLEGDTRAKYLFATAYHTAYVMGLLCAVALQPGRAPPVAVKALGAPRALGRRLLAALDRDQHRSHWREEVDELPSAAQDALANLFLAIGLRRSVAERDFSRLHEFIQLGHKAGLTDLPTLRQAAEILARIAHVSRGVQVRPEGATDVSELITA